MTGVGAKKWSFFERKSKIMRISFVCFSPLTCFALLLIIPYYLARRVVAVINLIFNTHKWLIFELWWYHKFQNQFFERMSTTFAQASWLGRFCFPKIQKSWSHFYVLTDQWSRRLSVPRLGTRRFRHQNGPSRNGLLWGEHEVVKWALADSLSR